MCRAGAAASCRAIFYLSDGVNRDEKYSFYKLDSDDRYNVSFWCQEEATKKGQ
jgi:hypothetical protein